MRNVFRLWMTKFGDTINWFELDSVMSLKNGNPGLHAGAGIKKFAEQQGRLRSKIWTKLSCTDIPSQIWQYKLWMEYDCPYPMRNPLKVVKAQISNMKANGDLKTGDLISTYYVKTISLLSVQKYFWNLGNPNSEIPLDILYKMMLKDINQRSFEYLWHGPLCYAPWCLLQSDTLMWILWWFERTRGILHNRCDITDHSHSILSVSALFGEAIHKAGSQVWGW